MDDWGLLVLRVVVGGLFAGHGAQKLLGWFGGDGIFGTADWFRSLGLRPALLLALMAGLSELGGGTLVALGLLAPLGPLAIAASMLVALVAVHWDNGVWAEQGGVELPLTDLAIALALALTGPGAYALDPLLGLALPMPYTLLWGALLTVAGVALVLTTRSRPAAGGGSQPTELGAQGSTAKS